MHVRARSAAILVVSALSVAGLGAGTAALAATPVATRTTLSTSTPTIGVGAPLTLKAVVKPVGTTGNPTGTVTFKEGATVLGTATLALVGTVETAKMTTSTLPVGSHQLTATYGGSTAFAASTSLPITVTVTKSPTTTKIKTSTPTVVVGGSVKLTAVVKQVSGTVLPTGTVTFTEGGSTVGTGTLALVGGVETAKVTLTGVPLGNHTYNASYSGSATFAASATTTPVTVAVIHPQTTTTVTRATAVAPYNIRFNIKVAPKAPATGIPTGTVTVTISGFAPQTLALNSTGSAHLSAILTVGATYTVTASYPGDGNYQPSSGSLTVTV